MDLKTLFSDNEAVSPVIGVILMVAITVILAAVIGTFVLGQADQLNENAPTVDFEYDGTPSSNYDVIHSGGDKFINSNVDVAFDGTSAAGTIVTDDWGTNGNEVNAGGTHTTSQGVVSGTTIRVNWASTEGGTSSTIGTYEVP